MDLSELLGNSRPPDFIFIYLRILIIHLAHIVALVYLASGLLRLCHSGLDLAINFTHEVLCLLFANLSFIVLEATVTARFPLYWGFTLIFDDLAGA